MDANGISESKPITPFLIECLVYNVPDYAFADDSYTKNVRGCIAECYEATAAEATVKSGLKLTRSISLPLFPTWTRQQANRLHRAAWRYCGFRDAYRYSDQVVAGVVFGFRSPSRWSSDSPSFASSDVVFLCCDGVFDRPSPAGTAGCGASACSVLAHDKTGPAGDMEGTGTLSSWLQEGHREDLLMSYLVVRQPSPQ